MIKILLVEDDKSIVSSLTVFCKVRSVMKRLRDKMEDDPQNPEILVTVRGLGY